MDIWEDSSCLSWEKEQSFKLMMKDAGDLSLSFLAFFTVQGMNQGSTSENDFEPTELLLTKFLAVLYIWLLTN